MPMQNSNNNNNFGRRIFECPKQRGHDCPVATIFYSNNSELPVLGPFRGNISGAKLLIVGINPGASANYLSPNYNEYLNDISEQIPKSYWQYYHITEVLGYPPLDEEGGIITNLVHCPTPSWTKQKDDKWKLSDQEKKRAIDNCKEFCYQLIDHFNPETVLLHGRPTIEYFSDYGWGVDVNDSYRKINGRRIEENGRTYILSQHLRSITWPKKDSRWNTFKCGVTEGVKTYN